MTRKSIHGINPKDGQPISRGFQDPVPFIREVKGPSFVARKLEGLHQVKSAVPADPGGEVPA